MTTTRRLVWFEEINSARIFSCSLSITNYIEFEKNRINPSPLDPSPKKKKKKKKSNPNSKKKKRFVADDLFHFNNVNLDFLTETYNLHFYFQYLAHWPEYFLIAQAPSGTTMGYIMGKAEGKGENWHGHVTAVTVAPEFRRLHLAEHLMHLLEEISEKT